MHIYLSQAFNTISKH